MSVKHVSILYCVAGLLDEVVQRQRGDSSGDGRTTWSKLMRVVLTSLKLQRHGTLMAELNSKREISMEATLASVPREAANSSREARSGLGLWWF